jgi:hypothetical protein
MVWFSIGYLGRWQNFTVDVIIDSCLWAAPLFQHEALKRVSGGAVSTPIPICQ